MLVQTAKNMNKGRNVHKIIMYMGHCMCESKLEMLKKRTAWQNVIKKEDESGIFWFLPSLSLEELGEVFGVSRIFWSPHGWFCKMSEILPVSGEPARAHLNTCDHMLSEGYFLFYKVTKLLYIGVASFQCALQLPLQKILINKSMHMPLTG